MASVVTLTGPSGSGKSTAVEYFLRFRSTKYRPRVIAKYSTRARRRNDGREIKAGCEQLPDECDLIYEQYGARYGIVSSEILRALEAGESPILIINDVRAVEDIRLSLGALVRSVFVYRTDPSLEAYSSLAAERGSSSGLERERRFQKAQAIYRIYIENIHLFDHVILNRFTRRELSVQIRRIVKGLFHDAAWPMKGKKPSS